MTSRSATYSYKNKVTKKTATSIQHRSGCSYYFYALTASFLGATFVSLIVTFPF